MCDRGILEIIPDAMKLEYCITITPELQMRIVEGISKLIGEPVEITNPKAGEYPQDKPAIDRNTIQVDLADKSLKVYSREVVSFSLKELSGCCGVLVSYHTRVKEKYRGKGINTFLQEIKEQIARYNNYTVLMATTREDNAAEIHILEKHGWVRTYDFVNNRTRNSVVFYMKTLTEKENKK